MLEQTQMEKWQRFATLYLMTVSFEIIYGLKVLLEVLTFWINFRIVQRNSDEEITKAKVVDLNKTNYIFRKKFVLIAYFLI
jgi:hypothetical protein